MVVLWLVAQFPAYRPTHRYNSLSILILASSAMFYAASGAVMTDMALLFTTTMVMVGFWKAQQRKTVLSSALVFAGFGLGMLAKGPVAVVLSGAPIAFYLLSTSSWRKLGSLHWHWGIPLSAAIALPWYLAAEHATPGFLQYFIIGEHVLRYLQPGWSGDLYGTAHQFPRGTIWLYFLVATLPWSPLFIRNYWLVLREQRRHSKHKPTAIEKAESTYLWCWGANSTSLFYFCGQHSAHLLTNGSACLCSADGCSVAAKNAH